MTNSADRDKLHQRFVEVFGSDNTEEHPLYRNLIDGLNAGRSIHSVLIDLDEAAAHRSNKTGLRAAGWHNENLSI